MTANCFIDLRDLIEFAWQISHSTKTHSTSRNRKMQDKNAIKTCSHFHI